MKDELLDAAGVARLMRWKVQTVYAYRSRGKLPEPDLTFPAGPLWYSRTIRRWAEDTGRST